MGLSNELSCEARSFFCCHNPHRFFQSEVLRLYLPTLEFWVVWSCSPGLPPSLSACKYGTSHYASSHLPWSASHCIARAGPPAATLLRILSAPPTSLDECFFFNFLAVGFRHISIFQQSWLFFVFKFVGVLLLVVGGGKVYLPISPSWPAVLAISFKNL